MRDFGPSRSYTTAMPIDTRPHTVVPAAFPELAKLVWNRDTLRPISCEEALHIYERNWRFVDVDHLDETERLFIRHLAATYGRGVLAV